MSALVGPLIRKDLFLVRWVVLGTLAAGFVALALLPLGGILTYAGGVSLVCALIILEIFVVLHGVAQERRERMLLFVLSLPVSPRQVTLSKVAAAAIAFGVPWLLLTASAVVLIDVSELPNGILPFWIALLAYLLLYFCALLAVALLKEANGWHVATIIVGNISVNFVIPLLLALPSVAANKAGAHAVWSADVVAVIALELGLGVVVLGLAAWRRARQPDFA
jgi:ABC-type transport system involved in multi-copper enzyme maturation permease subunit